MAVTEQQVRDFLDNPSATSVPSATITGNITRSNNYVELVAHTDATTAQKDDAVAAMAVWLTYGAYMEGITQQLGNISVADKTKLDHYRRVAELYLAQVAQQSIDLDDPASMGKEGSIPLDPSIFKLTYTEAFKTQP